MELQRGPFGGGGTQEKRGGGQEEELRPQSGIVMRVHDYGLAKR